MDIQDKNARGADEKVLVTPEGKTWIDTDTYRGRSGIERVVVSPGVTQIFDHAFAFCPDLKSVTLPESLVSLDIGVFEGCSRLEEIVLPEGLHQIGGMRFDDTGAFEGCVSLKRISIPAGTKIGSHTLRSCTALEEVIFGDGPKELPHAVFESCTSLKSIVIPEGVKEIAREAFLGCTSLEHVVLPESLTEIYSEAFSGCTSLEHVVLPESLTWFASEVFSGCTSLKSIVIPEGVERIPDRAFSGCMALCEVTMSESTKFGEQSFEDTPLQARMLKKVEERRAAYRAIKERPRRRLAPEEIYALKTVLIENDLLITALKFSRGYRGLGGSNPSSDWIREVDEQIPLSDLAGKAPYTQFGWYVRAVVDDIVYLTYGLEEDAAIHSFDEDGCYWQGLSAYDTEGSTSIRAVYERVDR